MKIYIKDRNINAGIGIPLRTAPDNTPLGRGCITMNSQTIYMTAAESERIRATAKQRVQKCQEVRDQARADTDALAVHQQVTMASLMADMAGPQEPAAKKETITAFAVGYTYPPCVLSMEELRPIALTELRLESHHRGRVLTVRRVAEVVELAARSWTVVEADGQKERLEVCLHKVRYGEEVLESGKVFRLKEPYFTVNDEGDSTLRIDHPSDLVICGEDAVEEGKGDAEAVKPAKSRKSCKEEGNAALKKQDLPQALARYTEGLQSKSEKSEAETQTVTFDLHRNRAHVNLLLNRCDEAKTDALAAVTNIDDAKHQDLDSKAYFRAGTAAYNLGDFDEAKGFFEHQRRLSPNDKDVVTITKRIEKRLKERDTGEYDFRAIRLGLSRARPTVDSATFTGDVEIKDSPGAGRGMFATRAFKPYERVMCEKAFCVVWGYRNEAWTAMTYDVRDDKIRATPAGLDQAVVQKLLNNPSQVSKVVELYGDYPGIGAQLVLKDGVPVIDTFQIRDIIARNGFAASAPDGREENARNASTGLWVRAAYINHSCMPNAAKEYIGDLMVIRAIRPVAAGDELTHSYDENPEYEARQKNLLTTWGFVCRCALCIAEEADGPELRSKRLELYGQASAITERENPLLVKRLVLAKLERVVKAIQETYEEERYRDVPRPVLTTLQDWIQVAKKKR
nr:set and mynd domain-containing protein [Quercus suber]